MSIIRFINDRNRKAAQLCRILEYAKREGKLQERYMTGVGISPVTAYEEMMRAKKSFHQEEGKQYLHLVVSFDKVLQQADTAHQIGRKIAEFYSDYQVLVTTHLNTDNLHCHMIINSVNMLTGKKLSQRRKDFWEFIEFANMVFEQYDLPRIGSQQVCELILEEDNDFWEDDLAEFDDMIHGKLAELEYQCGVQRPIYFEDDEAEREDVLRSIERMEQMMKKEEENA